ncbi:adenosylmethionine--8-amino-7-oxononanoate transaminase [Stackebrandtia nassauensis]|uniref:Adenosylmethionine-8-amino-7-oxononanoate aminotransferase n=1 Tax=Stackebrandtia nassauensis (strain DSM 44728 / CIP 108903 / NRRL B-16338 / NBRC 102104 / LLR-40K-21) TaxID=446470 RepID=D3Q4M5_STANL|nr:adenosylmethionine--8-amino-7-oxononanoate transaminase [Stackebrandtia nassauensis]ADD40185.1 adenosylmethionine-8-amino-7-oxononanoateamino transferase [Stackebrandtia nassauensis DSM 44728]
MGETESERWRRRDAAAVWHPFTQHSLWLDDEPTVVDRAEGPWLYDVDGNRYLDGVSSLWVTTFGHREPRIDAAIRDQLDRLDHATFLGATHPVGIELAERLLAVAPRGDRELSKVFYAGDGSSAVEVALKMAYQYSTQTNGPRPQFIRLSQAYHGDTLGAVSVGGVELFHDTYRPLLLKTLELGSPGVRRPGQSAAERAAESIEELKRLLAEHGDQVCALIVEPLVQGAAGMLTHHPDFLRAARELTDAHGVLLICDEVATGVGRTGRMWASQHADVVPDLLVTAKGITGGYLPLSAVLTTQAVYDAFLGAPARARTFFHGHTYTGSPLAAAAALANLRLMAETNLVDRAARLGDRLGARLAPLAEHPGVVEIRRLGTMTGVEVRPRGERTGVRVCRFARNRGVWIRPLGDTVILMPPLGLEDTQVDMLVDALAGALDEVYR